MKGRRGLLIRKGGGHLLNVLSKWPRAVASPPERNLVAKQKPDALRCHEHDHEVDGLTAKLKSEAGAAEQSLTAVPMALCRACRRLHPCRRAENGFRLQKRGSIRPTHSFVWTSALTRKSDSQPGKKTTLLYSLSNMAGEGAHRYYRITEGEPQCEAQHSTRKGSHSNERNEA